MLSEITFTSVLDSQFRQELEELLFFNPQQNKLLAGITDSINEYGVPSIHDDNGHLRIYINDLANSQTLYAIDHEQPNPVLAGVMVFVRTDIENIDLIHIAAKEDYTHCGKYANRMLVLRLLTQLRKNAKRIKGIQHINLKYSPKMELAV